MLDKKTYFQLLFIDFNVWSLDLSKLSQLICSIWFLGIFYKQLAKILLKFIVSGELVMVQALDSPLSPELYCILFTGYSTEAVVCFPDQQQVSLFYIHISVLNTHLYNK